MTTDICLRSAWHCAGQCHLQLLCGALQIPGWLALTAWTGSLSARSYPLLLPPIAGPTPVLSIRTAINVGPGLL